MPQDFIADGDDDLEHGVFGHDENICVNCNGSGYDDATSRVCDWCGGTGTEENIGDLTSDDNSNVDDITIIDIIGDKNMDYLTLWYPKWILFTKVNIIIGLIFQIFIIEQIIVYVIA